MNVVMRQSPARVDLGREPLSWGFVLGALCVPAIWILASPYTGIDGDARIYMARALADLDPNGVGRDIMFVLDGQSAFTIFGILAAKLVALLGPSNAALALALLNMAVWFTAMTALASRFASGRALAFLLVCAAVLPCCYGYYRLLESREIVAVPRPLSEAGVLFALASLCAGRIWLSLALLSAAALLHPIMALPGVGIVFLVQGLRDRRWFAALALVLAAAAGAALAGLPLFVRLTTIIDPAWRALLEDRNPYLFVSHWNAAGFSLLAVQSATLALGGMLTGGRPRTILFAVLAVAWAGVAGGWLLGDCLSSLLAVQAQLWRSQWLLAALAMPAFGLCALELPKRGQACRIALALLVFSWITFDITPVSALTSLAALGIVLVPAFRTRQFSWFFVPVTWVVLLGSAFLCKWPYVVFFWEYAHTMPSIQTGMAKSVWSAGLLSWPFLLLAVLWTRSPGTRREAIPPGSLLILLTVLIALSWDDRSPTSKRITSNVHDAKLEAMLATKPGEVLWLEGETLGPHGDQELYWLGRPQWNSSIQGAGIVFSRPLAMLWRDRTNLLISLGLANKNLLRPWPDPPKEAILPLTPSAITGLCARPDAPAWIVSPLPKGWLLPREFDGSVWHSPVRATALIVADQNFQWYSFDTYAVVPCAGNPALTASRS